MKSFFKSFAVITMSQSLVLSSACNKDSSEVAVIETELNVTKGEIEIRGMEAYKDSFHIQSNTSWTVSITPSNADWLLVSPTNGSNNGWITITAVGDNRSNAIRTATVNVTAGGNDQISIKQISISQRIFDVQDFATLLLGMWRLVKDSSTNTGDFYFQEGGQRLSPIPGVYWGKEEDYFDFKADGKVIMHGNNNTYNCTYQLLPNSQLLINEMLVIGVAQIIKLHRSEAIIDWQSTSPNGGQYYRRSYLTR